ncbi:3-hydroxyacyl-CoA dehydrogenase family protein [Chitinophaga horti]|uniref:3-hydroxyacyl-CoA dehydrogenase family protein n=1 Tax=Chitinophaga horti TaxID=2920382 RepID=A0ABY6J021_9BACT|nr:3-hydroxyacyl-CoA dehydrogenase family protein [Chitinophaga horti]UYQ93019.1 3-hydroxyacyl-CoA dehydrogenase family protein [Chitinophaga horti]
MNVLVIGDEQRWEAWKQVAGTESTEWKALVSEVGDWMQYQLVIDLSFDEFPNRVFVYRDLPHLTVLANMVKTSWKIVQQTEGIKIPTNVSGMNLLPGFMDMKVKEVTLPTPDHLPRLQDAMQRLGWAFEVVADQAGMVTPRVVSMIINEAYYALEQEVASREDIDTSMKLGTNYPYGPFEWCEKIGIREVFGVLHAVHTETGNERYRICELLRAEYFQQMEALVANSENSGADT